MQFSICKKNNFIGCLLSDRKYSTLASDTHTGCIEVWHGVEEIFAKSGHKVCTYTSIPIGDAQISICTLAHQHIPKLCEMGSVGKL